MSSVTEKYGKNLLNPLATNMNSADYKINELNNAINKFQKNASVTTKIAEQWRKNRKNSDCDFPCAVLQSSYTMVAFCRRNCA